MNKRRRLMVEDVRVQIEGLKSIIEKVVDEEWKSYYNLSLDLRYSYKGVAILETIDKFNRAMDSIDDVANHLSSAME